MMAGSVAFGFALGHLIPGSSSNGHKISQMASDGPPMESRNYLASSDGRQKEQKEQKESGSSRGSVLGSLMEKVRPEIQEIEGIAIGAIGALIRDLIRQNAAEPIAEQLEPVANRLTSKLGGRVIEKPLLSQSGDEE
jgi:hypothetical protein